VDRFPRVGLGDVCKQSLLPVWFDEWSRQTARQQQKMLPLVTMNTALLEVTTLD